MARKTFPGFPLYGNPWVKPENPAPINTKIFFINTAIC
jgi:hypothetical protein